MTIGISALYLAQGDGGLPTTLATGSAPGENGVSVFSLRFRGGLHFSATPRQHLIWFGSPVRIDCRIAGRTLRHEAPAGSLAICPAGLDCGADAEESVDALVVAIDPAQLALAAAESLALEAQLNEHLRGYDQALLDLARALASESAADYPNGPLYWNEVASGFIDGLVARHTSGVASQARGMLGKDVLGRLRDYVVAHLDEPIEVAALAGIAGRSPSHFSHVFTRSVGITPHRWVVHLRLQCAIELVREGRSGLAEIAARTETEADDDPFVIGSHLDSRRTDENAAQSVWFDCTPHSYGDAALGGSGASSSRSASQLRRVSGRDQR